MQPAGAVLVPALQDVLLRGARAPQAGAARARPPPGAALPALRTQHALHQRPQRLQYVIPYIYLPGQ